MIQHRRNNIILALKNREGHLIHSHEELEVELTHYFGSILKETRNDQAKEIKNITNHIAKILTEEHNRMLLRKVPLLQFEDVIMGMPNGKDPGLDNFTIDFYKSCWPILKLEFHALVEKSWI